MKYLFTACLIECAPRHRWPLPPIRIERTMKLQKCLLINRLNHKMRACNNEKCKIVYWRGTHRRRFSYNVARRTKHTFSAWCFFSAFHLDLCFHGDRDVSVCVCVSADCRTLYVRFVRFRSSHTPAESIFKKFELNPRTTITNEMLDFRRTAKSEARERTGVVSRCLVFLFLPLE